MRDLIGGDDHELAVGDDARRGRARPIVDDRHLADDLARSAVRQNDLASLALQEDLDAAAIDEIGARAGVSLREQQGAGGQRNSIERCVHGGLQELAARDMQHSIRPKG